jgi:hypothetical protein
LALLKRHPRNEGAWDSVVLAAFCEWIIRVEEEGMVNGEIPEVARVKTPCMYFDNSNRIAKMRCLQVGRTAEELVLRAEECWVPGRTVWHLSS